MWLWLAVVACDGSGDPKDPAVTVPSTTPDPHTTPSSPSSPSGVTGDTGGGTGGTSTGCDGTGSTAGPAIAGSDDPGASFDYAFGSVRAQYTLIVDDAGAVVSLCDPVEGELHSTLDLFFALRDWSGDPTDTAAYCEQRFVLDGLAATPSTQGLYVQLAVPANLPAAYESCWGNLGTSHTGTTSGLSLLAALGDLQLGVGPLDPVVAAEITASGGDPSALIGGWFRPDPNYVEVDRPERVSGTAEQLAPGAAEILRDTFGAPIPWDPASVPTASGIQAGRYALTWLDDWKVHL